VTQSGGGLSDLVIEGDQAVLEDSRAKVTIVVEHPRDIPPIQEIRSSARAQIRVIATSPAAAWALGKQEIPFLGIDAYCDDHTPLVKLGNDNFQRVQEICDLIDRELAERIPLLGEIGLRPAESNFLYLKILYDGLTLRREILGTLLAHGNPDLLLSIGDDRGNRGTGEAHTAPFSPDEHVFTTVLSCPGWSCRKGVIRVPPGDPGNHAGGRPGVPGRVRDSLLRSSALYSLAYTRRLYGTRRSLRLLSDMARGWISGGDRLLFTGFAYNWHYLIPELSARGYQISHLRLPAAGGGHDGVETGIERGLVEAVCISGGIDLTGVFLERANPVLAQAVREAETFVPRIRKELDRVRPAAVLCGARPRSLDHLPNRVARSKGIPVLSWQHGAQGINRAPIMPYVEMLGSDYHLCFGEGVRAEFGEEAGRFSCDLLPVGSFELQEISRARSSEQEFSVLYATTNYYENNLYVSAQSIFLDLELWKTQQAIIDLLGRSGKKTAFKLHPGVSVASSLSGFLEDGNYRNITTFRAERSFVDLARSSESIVLDFPSTALLQSIAAGKPVFILTKHLKLTDKALALLGRRAWCTGELPDFLDGLGRHLRGELPGPDIRNTEFLEEYGIFRLDGKVAGRAVDVLLEAIRKREEP